MKTRRTTLAPKSALLLILLVFCWAAYAANRQRRAAPAGGQGPDVACPSLRTEFVNGREVVAGEILVKPRGGASPRNPELLRLKEQLGVKEDVEVGGAGWRLFRSDRLGTSELLRAAATRAYFEQAEPNFVIRLDRIPNDARFRELWGLQNASKLGADIGAASAWDVTLGSRANVVAVLDTGTATSHPDLGGNLWKAPRAFIFNIGGQSVECPAQSFGYNALLNRCEGVEDDNRHGTHVAGVVGATGNNAEGVTGVNWNASMMTVKILDAAGSCPAITTCATAINGVEFAVQAKRALAGTSGANVRVLSNSYGWDGFSQAMLDEINRANANGMLFVASAGNAGRDNDRSPHYPASFKAPNVIAVAATDVRDGLASFSNYGRDSVHLGAPGAGILSTVPGAVKYESLNGTSMATPYVAGAAALILSACDLDPPALKRLILENTDPLPALAGKTVTGGRLNVDRALRACASRQSFVVGISPPAATASGGAAAYTVTVAPSGGFSGAVSLSADDLPEGASYDFNPQVLTGGGTSALTVSSNSVPPGAYPVRVNAVSGSMHRIAWATFAVPDFAIDVEPSNRTVARGGTANYTVSVRSIGGFNGPVSLSLDGVPFDTTYSFSPGTVVGEGGSSLVVGTVRTTPGCTHSLTIRGTSGSLVRSSSIRLVVKGADPPANSYTVSAIDYPATGPGPVPLPIDPLAGLRNRAFAINRGGQVAGTSEVAPGRERAFLSGGGRVTNLCTLDSDCNSDRSTSWAYGLNDRGEVVGSSTKSLPGDANPRHAFLYDGRNMIDISPTGGSSPHQSEARAVTTGDPPQVVGFAYTGAGGPYAFLYGAGQWLFLDRTPGRASMATAISGNSIVGWFQEGRERRAFIYLQQEAAMVDLNLWAKPARPGWMMLDAYGVHGEDVVGSLSTPYGDVHAYVFNFSQRKFIDLGALCEGTSSGAVGINSGGLIVGASETAGGQRHAFLYKDGNMFDLNALIPPNSGWVLTEATAVNDAGQIVGHGLYRGVVRAFIATPR